MDQLAEIKIKKLKRIKNYLSLIIVILTILLGLLAYLSIQYNEVKFPENNIIIEPEDAKNYIEEAKRDKNLFRARFKQKERSIFFDYEDINSLLHVNFKNSNIDTTNRGVYFYFAKYPDGGAETLIGASAYKKYEQVNGGSDTILYYLLNNIADTTETLAPLHNFGKVCPPNCPEGYPLYDSIPPPN